MPNGKAFIKHNFSAVIDDVIMAVYEMSNPTAELSAKRVVLNPPHSEAGLTVIGLNPVMHSFKFFQSSDGATLETLLLQLDIDASVYNESFMEPLTFVVGSGLNGAPNDGDYNYSNPDLADAEYYVFQPGFGLLVWGVHIEKDPAGGFTRIDGSPFAQDDVYTLFVFKSVAQQQGGVGTGTGTTTGGEYALETLSADKSFAAGDLGKHFRADSSSTILRVTFGASIPNGKVKFSTYTGEQRYLKLAFSAPVNFRGQKMNLWLAANESMELRFVDGEVIVENYSGNYNLVGTLATGRMAFMNTLPGTGGKYTKEELGRFYEDYIQLLPVNQVVTSLTAWNTETDVIVGSQLKKKKINKGKFCIVGSDVYLPDHTDVSVKFLAANTIGSGIGALEVEQIAKHKHGQMGGNDGGGTLSYVLDRNNDTKGQIVPLDTLEAGGDANRVDSHSMVPLYVI